MEGRKGVRKELGILNRRKGKGSKNFHGEYRMKELLLKLVVVSAARCQVTVYRLKYQSRLFHERPTDGTHLKGKGTPIVFTENSRMNI